MKKNAVILMLVGLSLSFYTCTKTIKDDTPNPFTGQNNNNTTPNPDTLDPASIAGLHKKIFSTRCALPACHDGSFEPDYRTIQSTYSTLVYHPVIKNDSGHNFVYRVIPYNPEDSWLVERLVTDDPVLGRMPLYANPLAKEDMDNLKKWIMEGCKDVNGKPAQFPNLYPQIITRFALDVNGNRIDTIFDGQPFVSPFVLAIGTTGSLYVMVKDDSTALNMLTETKFKFSYTKDDFSNPFAVKNATHIFGEWFMVPFAAAEFQQNKQIFFQFSCKDQHHSDPAEFPLKSSPFYFKDLFSFIVK